MNRIFLALVAAAAPLTIASAAPTVEQLTTAALSQPGNVELGKILFQTDARTKCATCHRVDGVGGEVGPDLSKIGGKFDRIHLIESLLQPSAQLVEGYQTNTILTLDGEILIGVIKEEDDAQFTLLDSTGKRSIMMRADVDSIQPSLISIMPDGLTTGLSAVEFTDLVAYLESLRAGMQTGYGADTKGPITVAPGYEMRTLVTGLDAAVTLETLDDGRILICEQKGNLRVIKDGKLLPTPMLSIDVECYWERGLIGVTKHPDFPRQPWIYVCYVTDVPYSHHVVSRFRVDGDIADPASEQRLIEGDDQELYGGFKKSGHQGGGIHFGRDGNLYIGLGEQTAKTPAQDLTALQGKILRIGDDGRIPGDNPFLDRTTGKYRSIWAMGLRNPFSFAFDPSGGSMLINDVGGQFEEINVGVAGGNYGWPVVDHGQHADDRFVDPIHIYPEASISGGAFAPLSAGPELSQRYVFGDFVHGWIHWIDPDNPTATNNIVSGLRRPVDLRFGPGGELYVLLRNAWIMDDKIVHDSGSLLMFK